MFLKTKRYIHHKEHGNHEEPINVEVDGMLVIFMFEKVEPKDIGKLRALYVLHGE
jgi:hypothetical protein